MEESDPSTLESDYSEESDSSEGDEYSDDQVDDVVDDMRSTRLGGSRQDPALNKGM